MATQDRKQSKPLVYFLVMLPLLAVGVFVVFLLLLAYTRIAGIPISAVASLNGVLICVPAFVLWMLFSLMMGNIVLCSVPAFRRIVERYVSETGRPGFVESQKELAKWFLLTALICIPIVLLGFIL